ncbi:MAG: type II toxin-antitoxin system VapC family toxin [Burkholderiales bacterium]|nr:type II toxin-antitoxin system VapC family toxin [Burkholderiales bacterium]
MVIDASALLAILRNEPERRRFNEAIEAADTRRISATTFVEVSIVLEARYGAEGVRDLDLLCAKAGLVIAPVDAEQAELARRAWRLFGNGRHAAGLNYGDCFAYALAASLDDSLLFKGTDFAATDVRAHEACSI